MANLTTLDLASSDINRGGIADNVFTDVKVIPPPFSHLLSLVNLKIHSQGLYYLPSNFLEGLTSLSSLGASHLFNKVLLKMSLHPDTFIYTPKLEYLDFNKINFVTHPPELFHPIPRLKRLHLSECQLQSLDFLIGANLTEVEFLQVNQNETVIHTLPALIYLDMRNNPFSCDCSNAWFIQWVKKNSQTQVIDAHEFVCTYPKDLHGTKLRHTVDFFYFISTTSLVLCTLLGSFIYHFLRWQVVYAYYLLLAYLQDTKRRNSCKPIIDNITDAIYRSRKTICVISRRYLESEWCSREIQVVRYQTQVFWNLKTVLSVPFGVKKDYALPYTHTHSPNLTTVSSGLSSFRLEGRVDAGPSPAALSIPPHEEAASGWLWRPRTALLKRTPSSLGWRGHDEGNHI
ncbi:unnamed protein product [Coregonus sp. 'balchen']|nr:unnamed protein product [Coregonus sp. 'balchen']